MTHSLFYTYITNSLKLFCVAVATVYLMLPLIMEAATLSVSPATGVYEIGDTFIVQVRVNTQGANINAAEGTLNFDPSKLSVVRVQKGSVFNLWTSDPSFSNTAGTVTFSGGNPTGYTGSGGSVITVTLRAKAAGSPRVTMTGGAVLAADGRGTNVLSTMAGGTSTVSAPSATPEAEVVEYVPVANTPGAPTITSATHRADGWSKETTAELTWSVPGDVTAVRTLLSNSPSAVPTKVYEPPINSLTLEGLEEGKQYLHVQFRNGDGWGAVTHYRLAVDTNAPTDFTIVQPEGFDPSQPEQQLQLQTEDGGSGVVRFEVQLDGGEPYEFVPEEQGTSTILILPALDPGKHTVIIEAFDAANNSLVSTYSFTITAFDRPQFLDVPERISAGVVPAFRGQTRPNASVTIALEPIGADVREVTVQADAEGLFTYIPERALATGVYDLSAVATDTSGAVSEPSDRIRFVVEEPGYVAIGSFMVSVLSVVVPLTVLLLVLVALLVYGGRRIMVIGSTVRRETNEALAVIDTEFAALESQLEKEATAVAKTRKSAQLTKAEAAFVAAMKEQIQVARQRVQKEVSEVDDIVEKNTNE
jgi:hypothetical protein